MCQCVCVCLYGGLERVWWGRGGGFSPQETHLAEAWPIPHKHWAAGPSGEESNKPGVIPLNKSTRTITGDSCLCIMWWAKGTLMNFFNYYAAWEFDTASTGIHAVRHFSFFFFFFFPPPFLIHPICWSEWNTERLESGVINSTEPNVIRRGWYVPWGSILVFECRLGGELFKEMSTT